MRVLRLGFRLGLFQLSLGILGVLMLGLFNRLLIAEIGLPAAVVALAIGTQQLMGFTRIWFGNRSDRSAAGRLKRTPYIVISALFFFSSVGTGGMGGSPVGSSHHPSKPTFRRRIGWPLDADFDRPWDGDFCGWHGLFRAGC